MMTVAEKMALEGYCILTPVYSVSEKIDITKKAINKFERGTFLKE